MPDFSIATAPTCSTNLDWSVRMPGSKGAVYTVRWCRQFNAEVQYGYECTCAAFKHGRGVCKHIRQVIAEGKRCGWNEALEPTLEAPNGKCPKCGQPAAYERVAV